LKIADLIFLDEFSINVAMTRSHARAPKGERARVTEVFNRGNNISVVSAMGLHGVLAPMTIAGSINSEVFDLYVAQMLVPNLRSGNIVLLDRVKFHYSPRAIELMEAAGVSVLHIPAYSPDCNPIEQCISKIKEVLRALKARTQRKLSNALAKAIATVTESDIRGWFEHCGYVFSLK
jgi:transposase